MDASNGLPKIINNFPGFLNAIDIMLAALINTVIGV
jgi:hypothetical protein